MIFLMSDGHQLWVSFFFFLARVPICMSTVCVRVCVHLLEGRGRPWALWLSPYPLTLLSLHFPSPLTCPVARHLPPADKPRLITPSLHPSLVSPPSLFSSYFLLHFLLRLLSQTGQQGLTTNLPFWPHHSPHKASEKLFILPVRLQLIVFSNLEQLPG